LAERCPGGQTNNRAELIAIARVLETTPFRRGRLTIKTDSRYSIDCFDKWLGGWQKNGWLTAEKKAVKNAELIRYIAALLEARVRIGQKVFLEYVKGHVGIQGNEGADRLANMGCTMSEVEERDWESLRQDYMAKVEDLIAARKLQLAQKDQRGIIEVVGAKEASEDLQKEIETEEGTEASNKVRRVGEVAGAGVKDSPVVRGQATRTYSAGIAKPSDEDLEAFAQSIAEEEDLGDTPPTEHNAPAAAGKLFSAGVEPSKEELDAYADAWDSDEDNGL